MGTKGNIKISLVTLVLLLAITSTSSGRTIFVDANTPDSNDGSSWAKAYKYLQNALADANSSGDVNQIWVAQGIYKPDCNSADPNGSGDREATFRLINGVTLKGGYAGFSEPDANARNIELYETTLSGDINTPGLNTDNSYNVVRADYTNTSAVLDGFTITDGSGGSGGGVHCESGSPIIRNCIIRGNNVTYDGGGLFWNLNSNLTVENCIIINNTARQGGGIHCQSGYALIKNCVISSNQAEYAGGISCIGSSDAVFTNCTISDNTASNNAGGISIAGNGTEPILVNCILWGNIPQQIYVSNANPTVTYNNIQGGWPEGTNIDADPCFADVDANDFHLKSQAGRWDETTQSWVQDNMTSPCIDAGDPDSSIGYELFPNGGRVNMGAYGETIEASKSYFGSPVCEKNIAGDINGDCVINFIDFAFMASHWLEDNNP